MCAATYPSAVRSGAMQSWQRGGGGRVGDGGEVPAPLGGKSGGGGEGGV